MKPEPCSVCGGTDMNLIDGFYYCVECGTQDVNAQETVVEQTVLGDGTFAHAASRKVVTILKDAIEMSGEWHKWHTFNFILHGLVEELMVLRASEGFKKHALWIWTRYMKKYQNKEEMGRLTRPEEKEAIFESKLFFEEDVIEDESTSEKNKQSETEYNEKPIKKSLKRLKIVTKGLLLAILYIALNLDRSDIQISHLIKFIKEGRISIVNCKKFIPKELNIKAIPQWNNFQNCIPSYTSIGIRQISMDVIQTLNLGATLVPDLNKIVDNYIKELCLPAEFKDLVFSLMEQVSPEFLDYRVVRKSLVRIPDYEGFLMAYVLVALKMCFGLDDQYEIELSGAVDKINDEEYRLKSHKLGLYSNTTDRLFSFREWCNYLQFRKVILSKYYLPIAQQFGLDPDEKVIVEQSGITKKPKELTEEVTMDILNKISIKDEGSAIPKSEFQPSLTPMTSYTDVVLQYFQEPDLKLLLSEDFTQYSLKYACEDLKLPEKEITLQGVKGEGKTIEPVIVGTLVSKRLDTSLVYVRNCENKNWLKTKPPTVDHMTKLDDDDSEGDRDSDRGYDSNTEMVNYNENNIDTAEDTEKSKSETVEEEGEGISIFDDPFDNVDDELKQEDDIEPEINSFDFNNEPRDFVTENFDDHFHDGTTIPSVFNPETFDREKAIKELILHECKNFRIPIPPEYRSNEPRKRRIDLVHYGAGESEAKKIKIENRAKPGEAQRETDKIIAAYYTNLAYEDVADHLRSVMSNFNPDEQNDQINHETADIPDADDTENINRDNITFNEDMDKTLEPSVLDDNINIDDLLPKSDPRFDEKTHHINQLYVKFSENFEFENILDLSDPTLNKILDEKIEQSANIGVVTPCYDDVEGSKQKESNSDSEDDIPSILQKEMPFMSEAKSSSNHITEPLIKTEIKEFKYWLRHYSSATMKKTHNLTQKFDLELQKNCPRSFNFIIQECASIVDCTAYSLYKNMQLIEQFLINKVT